MLRALFSSGFYKYWPMWIYLNVINHPIIREIAISHHVDFIPFSWNFDGQLLVVADVRMKNVAMNYYDDFLILVFLTS